jgi:hypothetical protein
MSKLNVAQPTSGEYLINVTYHDAVGTMSSVESKIKVKPMSKKDEPDEENHRIIKYHAYITNRKKLQKKLQNNKFKNDELHYQRCNDIKIDLLRVTNENLGLTERLTHLNHLLLAIHSTKRFSQLAYLLRQVYVFCNNIQVIHRRDEDEISAALSHIDTGIADEYGLINIHEAENTFNDLIRPIKHQYLGYRGYSLWEESKTITMIESITKLPRPVCCIILQCVID